MAAVTLTLPCLWCAADQVHVLLGERTTCFICEAESPFWTIFERHFARDHRPRGWVLIVNNE